MEKKDKLIAFMVLPLSFSVAAQPQTAVSPYEVTTGISLGTLSGVAKERVYEPEEGGRKVSQLDWRYRHVAVVQGFMEWQVRSWLSFGAQGWTTLSQNSANMEDFDWLLASQKKWSNHSSHPNTRLNFANQWDLHLTGWLVHQPRWRFGVMGGYRQDRTSFSARGGTFSNNNGAEIGRFPNVKAIGYAQRFGIPYVGLTGRYRHENIEAATSLKYSRWGGAQTIDQHYLRSLTFRDSTRQQQSFSLSASVGYYLTQQVKLYLESTWNRTLNKKGDNISVFSNGDIYARASFRNIAGIEQYALLTTAGLVYHF